jgi:hypothetical protein
VVIIFYLQLSSKIDADLFLEDEGSGSRMDDLEISGSGHGDDDGSTDDSFNREVTKAPPKAPPKSKEPVDIVEGGTKKDPTDGDITIDDTDINNNNIFDVKEESSASFFSQPGILAGKLVTQNTRRSLLFPLGQFVKNFVRLCL